MQREEDVGLVESSLPVDRVGVFGPDVPVDARPRLEVPSLARGRIQQAEP